MGQRGALMSAIYIHNQEGEKNGSWRHECGRAINRAGGLESLQARQVAMAKRCNCHLTNSRGLGSAGKHRLCHPPPPVPCLWFFL